MRKASQKRKIQESSLNPNDLTGYYVGSEVNPGGWRRQDTDPEKVWTNSDRILPRYVKVPKNCDRLERHGTYNTNRFIALKSGDFYPGELIIFDFPPVNNELPITKRSHVKANRIYDIKHRRLQDDTGLKTFKQYQFIVEHNLADFKQNAEIIISSILLCVDGCFCIFLIFFILLLSPAVCVVFGFFFLGGGGSVSFQNTCSVYNILLNNLHSAFRHYKAAFPQNSVSCIPSS